MTPGGAESRNEKPYAGPYATVALQGADGPANGHSIWNSIGIVIVLLLEDDHEK